MAIGATKGKAGIIPESAPVVVSGSSRGMLVLSVNDNALTAQGLTNKLYGPMTITDSTFHWLPISVGVTRIEVQARVARSTVTAITSPKIAIIGMWRTDPNSTSDPAAAVADEFHFDRIDADMTAAGTTLTFPASPVTSPGNCRYDGTNWYSAIAGGVQYDIRGAHYIGIVVTNAGASTGSVAMPIDVLLLN